MVEKREINAVLSHLLDIADERNLRIIGAREYGSRARGFADDDSDYDVFFVYLQRMPRYVSGGYRETIDLTVDEDESRLGQEIEFTGWDIKKFTGGDGLSGSNPMAMAYVMSDDEYVVDRGLRDPFEAMLDHAESNFKPYALMNHWRSMTAKQYGKYIEGDYKLAEGVSYDDLMDYADPPWGGIQEDAANNLTVDEEKTKIGDEVIDVYGRINWTLPVGEIPIEDALERDLVERTTTQPTVRRHLHGVRSMVNARIVEETHELPPNDFNTALATAWRSDWLPDDVWNDMKDIVAAKQEGNGESEIEKPDLYTWFSKELGRAIDPEPHVQQTPDKSLIRHNTRRIVEYSLW